MADDMDESTSGLCVSTAITISGTQSCPHFRVLEIEEFHSIQRCPHFRGLE